MFRKELLLGKLVEKGHTLGDLSDHLGINITTLYRKMNSFVEFKRSEIQMIRNYLDLTSEDVDRIFFAE